ncbi:UNVERIFIED_CONTAM: hypothetical protein FKN15_050242 [Acipenser sinensis]
MDIGNGSGLHDGQWHNVRFLAKENFAMLTIDGDEASAVRTNSPLYIKTGNKYYFGGSGLHDGQWHNVRFLAKENFAMLTIDGDEASAVRTNSPLYIKTGNKYYFGGSGLHDGQWHNVRFLAKENFAMLTIDGDEASAVRTNSPLYIKTGNKYYFGGCMQLIHVDDQMADLHAVEQGKLGSFENVSIDMCAIIDRLGGNSTVIFLSISSLGVCSVEQDIASLESPGVQAFLLQRSFQGCMQLIHVDDQMADLHAVEQGKLGSFENVSIDMCAIIDRTCNGSASHNTARYTQFNSTYSSGIPGATFAIYEQSCEAYKHLGKTSDAYWIDPDGSGPLGPFKVHCNMTEDKVWTTVIHDLQPQTSVSSSSQEKRTVLQLNYSASMEQVSAITTSAEHCEQYVSYSCRMSRLLNTPGKVAGALPFISHTAAGFLIP